MGPRLMSRGYSVPGCGYGPQQSPFNGAAADEPRIRIPWDALSVLSNALQWGRGPIEGGTLLCRPCHIASVAAAHPPRPHRRALESTERASQGMRIRGSSAAAPLKGDC